MTGDIAIEVSIIVDLMDHFAHAGGSRRICIRLDWANFESVANNELLVESS